MHKLLFVGVGMAADADTDVGLFYLLYILVFFLKNNLQVCRVLQVDKVLRVLAPVRVVGCL